MPPDFLTIPQEIRDEIYSYLLVSPTSYVEPLPAGRPPPPPHPPPARELSIGDPPPTASTQSKRTTQSPSTSINNRFILSVRPLASSSIAPTLPDRHAEHTTFLSLSILRVCRQIHHEASHIFYERNTLHFATLYSSKHHQGVIRTLKGMGQVASRRIVSVSIHMTGLRADRKDFGQVLQLLASRSRQGHFKKLELGWDLTRLIDLATCNVWRGLNPHGVSYEAYDELLEKLRRPGEEGNCRYERVLRLPMGMRNRNADYLKSKKVLSPILEAEEFVMVLHHAFGGRAYWGTDLAWENGSKTEGIGYYRG